MPNSDQRLSILQFTDLHLIADPNADYKGFNSQKDFDAVLATAQSNLELWPPDAIVLTGDLVQDDSQAAYERLAAQAASWQVPVFCLPGNHDVTEFFTEILPSATVSIAGGHTLPQRSGNNQYSNKQSSQWRIIMLDTTQANNVAGHIRTDELARLEQELIEHCDKAVLICMHHPAVDIGSAWLDEIGLRNAKAFWTIIKRQQDQYNHIQGVLCGHIHQALDTQKHGIPVMGSPSTSRQFKPQAEQFAVHDIQPGFRQLILRHQNGQATLSSEVIRVDSSSTTCA